MQRGVPDPYRELGVQRAATELQIKAAYRKLAKRFHPDTQGGDTPRFLAIQEAYLLLSDPLRRRDWDTRHAPGPVRAGEPTRRATRPRASDGRWTREEGTPGGTRPRQSTGGARRPAQARPSEASGGPSETGNAGSADPRAAHDRRENRADPDWNASGRDPSTRSYRWSAENVPWWEDFSPRGSAEKSGGAEAKASGRRPSAGSKSSGSKGKPRPPGAGAQEGQDAAAAASQRAPTPPAHPEAGAKPDHADVYSRSSGAAWSSAARRYFRKGDTDLPSRGAFVFRGTQVVTGAKAREASEELLRRRPDVGPSPRQAFEPRPADAASWQAAEDGQAAPRSADPALDDLPSVPLARRAPSLVGAAVVGGGAAFVVTLPALILGSFVLNPPLQPMFALIVLLLAALAGAVAAAAWVRFFPRND